MQLISTEVKNDVLHSMIQILSESKHKIIAANKLDLDQSDPNDRAMYDRLIVDEKKVDSMIQSVREVLEQSDPVGRVKSIFTADTGLKVINKTAPFGTILIIYESRPDVTIEAAVLAFKANSKILLKGGKEAIHSNKALIECWELALTTNGLPEDLIQLMQLDRKGTQEYLRNPTEKLDLIVPRGGEQLIAFVKEHAQCPVLVSGRGNNFLYIHETADWDKSISVILNAKTQKISACNALDKILLDEDMPEIEEQLNTLIEVLSHSGVEVLLDKSLSKYLPVETNFASAEMWYEEFLAMKILLGSTSSIDQAIVQINKYAGGHSASIMCEDEDVAKQFMDQVDCAAVYHNASTRFTDGGQMGTGAELAISTDKLHHRGPLGLEQLVTNKYYVYGDGHVRD